jgi:hypothetical protein
VPRFGLVDGPYRFVFSAAGGRRVEELYRREASGGETRIEAPALAARMGRSLAQLRRDLGDARPERRRALTPQDREALHVLGYAEPAQDADPE